MKTAITTTIILLALTVLAIFTCASRANAQQTSPAVIAQCAGPESPWRDFDFFVGEWAVFDPDSGQKYGDNNLTLSESGCLIMGRWINVNGGTGSSMNFYDPLQNKWRQLWQSAPAFVDQSGSLDNEGRMQMDGRIFYHRSGISAQFRGTWTPINPDRFLQEFWQYDSASEQWNLWFRGEYRRKKSGDLTGTDNQEEEQ